MEIRYKNRLFGCWKTAILSFHHKFPRHISDIDETHSKSLFRLLYRYTVRINLAFSIRNAQQVNALREVCNGDFICIAHDLH